MRARNILTSALTIGSIAASVMAPAAMAREHRGWHRDRDYDRGRSSYRYERPRYYSSDRYYSRPYYDDNYYYSRPYYDSYCSRPYYGRPYYYDSSPGVTVYEDDGGW